MSTLDSNQIAYMKNVLGVESVVFDTAAPVLGQALAQASFHPLRMSAVPANPKLIVIGMSSDTSLPFEADAKDLLGKMIQAMKLDQKDVLFIEWAGADLMAPSAVREMTARFAQTPVLSFGSEAAAAIGAQGAAGEWVGNGKFLSTHALSTLLRRPDLKKDAWVHLQKVMKVIA